jgi:hypothetical protein
MAAKRKQQPPAEIPAHGLTSQLMRLTYPGRWHNEAAAQRFARDNGLTTAGVSIVEAEGAWRIVIDTHRAPMLTPWLRQQYPGVAWGVSWAPTHATR